MEAKRRILKFDPVHHKYTDEQDFEYTSVTTLISKYHEQFNKEYWAKYKADEAGITPEQIKANWEAITKFRQDKGTSTHGVLEDSVNAATGKADFTLGETNRSRPNTEFVIIFNKANLEVLANTPLAKRFPKIYNYLRTKILDGWSLYAEKRVYWFDYLIAGTIDLLLIKGKDFIIVDWKTNKDELKFEAGYYKKDPITKLKTNIWVPKKTYFFTPIASLEFCKGMIYTLQLSIYAHLLELWGYRCIGLELFHIRDNDEPKLYHISYVQWAAQILCTHFKLNPTNPSSTSNNEIFGIT